MRRRSVRPDGRGLSARRASAAGPVLLALLPTLLLLLPLVATVGCSGNSIEPSADDQLGFGVRMAQRGLWSEALFRFERARESDPSNPRSLNNIAVALEAAGRYDEALEAYREALRLAPGNRDLEENYARFVDFYQSFQTDPSTGLDAVRGDAPDAMDGALDDPTEEPR